MSDVGQLTSQLLIVNRYGDEIKHVTLCHLAGSQEDMEVVVVPNRFGTPPESITYKKFCELYRNTHPGLIQNVFVAMQEARAVRISKKRKPRNEASRNKNAGPKEVSKERVTLRIPKGAEIVIRYVES